MAKDSITIKWNSADASDYEASLGALQQYEQQPEIKTAISLKGRIPPDAVKQIVDLLADHDVEVGVTLKAEWAETGQQQLRLFAPDYTTQTVADIEGWLRG